MKKLARLWKRPSYDGMRFTYSLIYYDQRGKRRQKSLGHADARKAERQRAQLERELRMGIVEPGSMKLSDFLEDNLTRTRGQVRESTLQEARTAMEHFIRVIGNIDYLHVKHEHGERFMQACLDEGNTPATVAKKLRHLKRLFQLAVDRDQMENNPLRRVSAPSVPNPKVRVYSEDECDRLIKAARESGIGGLVRWELLIMVAKCTAMRRGELLNTTWQDIDFANRAIDVSPKQDAEQTWQWHIKDTDRRRLPLTDELVQLLAQHQLDQPTGHPYVFVPPHRYEIIQQQRRKGRWTVMKGRCPLNNFNRQFKAMLLRAGIAGGKFHDLRATCLSGWLSNGLREYEVMLLAGHSKFETTRRFYLAVREDLMDRARLATAQSRDNSVAELLQVSSRTEKEKSCQPQVVDSD